MKTVLVALMVVSVALSGCAAVPAAAGAVKVAVEVAPIVVPLAVDVSNQLAIQSANMAAGLAAGLTEEQIQRDYREGILWVADGRDHANERHGEIAQTIRDCLEKNGAVEEMYQPKTERFAQVCKLPGGGFGVRVCSAIDECEVTSFPKEKMSALEEVVHYLQNVGYTFTQ